MPTRTPIVASFSFSLSTAQHRFLCSWPTRHSYIGHPLSTASPCLAPCSRSDPKMEPTSNTPAFPSPRASSQSVPTFPVAEPFEPPVSSRQDPSGTVDMSVHPVGGFNVPQHESIHVVAGEVVEPSEPRISMPSPTSSSITAVSAEQSPPQEPINIVFPIIEPHIDPETNRAMPRYIRESHALVAPRKGRQFPVLNAHDPYTIPALNTTDFPHWVCPPGEEKMDIEKYGWRDLVHPDGTLYFYGQFRFDSGPLRMYTESYLHGHDLFVETIRLATYMSMLVKALPSGSIHFPNVDLVINVEMGGEYDQITWSYYFVDHSRKMLFWLRPYNPEVSIRTTQRLGVSSPDHLCHLLRAMYWEHCALFPRRAISENTHASLVANLTWCASNSVITPLRYTAPWTAEEAAKLREQVDYLRAVKTQPDQYIEVAGRTLSMLERWRYDFLHGTQVVRRFRGQTVLPARKQTVLYKSLLPLLFYAPLAHLYDYESVYLDGVLANEPEWTRHVKKLLAEWQEFVLYATILLNANLAFLSVPNTILFPDGDSSSSDSSASSSDFQHALVSPTAIMSYCSMLASIGSIIIGLLLIRQHRGEEIMDNPRTDKDKFMEKRRYKKSGFELVSIQYSLPYALLMWSIIMFLASLMIFTQLGTDRYTRGTALAMLGVVVIFAIWCIQLGWGTSQNRGFFGKVKDPWAPSTIKRITTRAKAGMRTVQKLPRGLTRHGMLLGSTAGTLRHETGEFVPKSNGEMV
ncbi:unnamed protein product [Peniophora sp. CBMAI 1063]|nr:unnamed protein product [Peniophora sp. CBMAI 1063]